MGACLNNTEREMTVEYFNEIDFEWISHIVQVSNQTNHVFTFHNKWRHRSSKTANKSLNNVGGMWLNPNLEEWLWWDDDHDDDIGEGSPIISTTRIEPSISAISSFEAIQLIICEASNCLKKSCETLRSFSIKANTRRRCKRSLTIMGTCQS